MALDKYQTRQHEVLRHLWLFPDLAFERRSNNSKLECIPN